MSKGARVRAGRVAVAQPELALFCVPGAIASPTDRVSMRKTTHDLAIAGAGAARRSGVTWYEYAMPGALEVLEDLLATQPASTSTGVDDAGFYEVLRASPDALLIVASVEVAVPRAFTGPS